MSEDRTRTHVILGDGVAGMSAAEAIRQERPGDTIIVVSDDPQPFYFRAALTNYLLGELSDDELWALPPRGFDDLRINRRAGRVKEIDFTERVVRLKKGPELRYDRLLIATGCRARRIETPAQDPKHGVPGADFAGVCVLRTLQDTQRVLDRLESTKQAVVVGGGILGLELAQGLVARNIHVTLLHRGPWLLERVVDFRAGELIRLRMQRDGVDVKLGAAIAKLTGSDAAGVRGVVLDDGTTLPCQLVGVAVGNAPNTEFLRNRLALVGGYVPVDARMVVRADPALEHVFAAGDVAVVEDKRLPFKNPGGLWQPARKQGTVAGKAMAAPAGAPLPEYRPGVLYNATRAWDLDLATLGCHVGDDASGTTLVEFSDRRDGQPVYKRAAIRDGRVVGALLLGDRREGQALRRLMNLRGAAGDVSTIAARLFDPEFNLFRWVADQEHQPGVRRHDEPFEGPRGADPEAIARRRRDEAPARVVRQRELGTAPVVATALTHGLRSRPLTLVVGSASQTFEGGRVRVGASPRCDVVVPEVGLGDEELVLSREGAAWIATAVGARQPRATRNAQSLGEPVALCDHDLLTLGRWKAVVHLPPVGPAREEAHVAGSRPAWLLGVRRYPLAGAVVRVGRHPDNDVVIADASVGRFHAQVQHDATSGGWYLKDFGSARGTFVGDEPVTLARRLSPGDVIRFGTSATLKYEEGVEVALDPAAPTVVRAEPGGGRAYLVGVEGPLARRALAVPLPGTIGRGAAADVRLDDPLLSRVHARFDRSAGGISVTDLGSVNGVALAGDKIATGLAVRLAEGAELRIGKTRWKFQSAVPHERLASVEEMGPAAPTEGTTQFYRADGPRLRVEQHGTPVVYPLVGERLTVGSDARNDVVIPRSDVSGHHAVLVLDGDAYAVDDLRSTNGTRVAGIPVDPGTPQRLTDGAKVSFGPVQATFVLGSGVVRREAAALARATLTVLAPLPDGSTVPPILLVGDGPFVIGRKKPDAYAVIPLETVSRVHAQLRCVAGVYVLCDRGSRYGTFQGAREGPSGWKPGAAIGAKEVPLRAGEVFFLQDIAVRFDVAAAPVGQGGAPAPRNPALSVRLADGANPLDADLERVVREEVDACIGCHDCMRACPLPEAVTVTIAGLNAFAQGIGRASDVVERFVADCTQCHACVPVCPADLQRSRIVLFNKMKEDRKVDPGRKITAQVGDEQVASDRSVGDLVALLRDHPLVRPLAADERLAFLSRARLRRLQRGEHLLTEGTFPDAMWLVLEGKIEVGMAMGGRDFQRMVVHGPGETLGEVALLSDQPSELAARAQTTSTVVGFAKYVLLHHAGRSPGFRATLEGLYVAKAAMLHPARWPALEGVSAAALDDLRQAVTVQQLAPGEEVLSAREQAGECVLVQRGFVRELRRDPDHARRRPQWPQPDADGRQDDLEDDLIVANYLKAGEGFGGGDSEQRGEAVRFEASTKAEVVRISLADLAGVEARHPGSRIVERVRKIVRPRRAAGTASPDVVRGAERLGLLQGSRLLVIDTRLCVDCDNCVTACERRHGASRLDRAGSAVQVGPYQVPASCYHCDNPTCLLCAEEAIVRLATGEIQIQEHCIGCGACAERCPYDNIQMIPRDPPKPRLVDRLVPDPILRWLGLFQESTDEDLKRVAVKCDLCVGFRDGPACVRSCPVGAAFRGDPREIFLGETGGAS